MLYEVITPASRTRSKAHTQWNRGPYPARIPPLPCYTIRRRPIRGRQWLSVPYPRQGCGEAMPSPSPPWVRASRRLTALRRALFPVSSSRSRTLSRITSYNVCYTKLLRFVEENLLALELICRKRELSVYFDPGPEFRKGEKMGVQASPSDYVAAGRRKDGPSGTGEQGSREENRGADPLRRITSYNVCYTKLLRNGRF